MLGECVSVDRDFGFGGGWVMLWYVYDLIWFLIFIII